MVSIETPLEDTLVKIPFEFQRKFQHHFRPFPCLGTYITDTWGKSKLDQVKRQTQQTNLPNSESANISFRCGIDDEYGAI